MEADLGLELRSSRLECDLRPGMGKENLGRPRPILKGSGWSGIESLEERAVRIGGSTLEQETI